MTEIFDRTLTVPESMLEGPGQTGPEPDFSGPDISRSGEDIEEIIGQTRAEMVGDKLFYGTVGAAALTLAAGVVAGKKLVAKR